jgi:dipeptidyl aminopeptidase/acylaminoacyl peptidase
MKIEMSIILLVLSCYFCNAQKPALTVSDCQAWPEVTRPGLSKDGRYAYYKIENQRLGKSTFYVHSIKDNWTRSLGDLTQIQFDNNSKYLYAIINEDTLLIIDLYKQNQIKKPGINSFRLFMMDNQELIALKSLSDDNLLLITNVLNNRIFECKDVSDFIISNDGSKILLQKHKPENRNIEILEYFDLHDKKSTIIYSGNNISRLITDNTSTQFAFTVKSGDFDQIWYYKTKMPEAINLASNFIVDKDDTFKISPGYDWRFNQKGTQLFFSVHKCNKTIVDNPNEIIWNYKNPYLPADFLNFGDPIEQTEFYSSININTKKIIKLVGPEEEWLRENLSNPPDDYIIIEKRILSEDDKSYDLTSRNSSYFLRSTETGESIPIKTNCDSNQKLLDLSVSPEAKFVIFYDESVNRYASYSLEQNKITILGQDMTEGLIKYNKRDIPDSIVYRVGVAGWLPNDKRLWIYGTKNIWELDPAGEKRSINLTGSQNPNNDIIFYLPINHYKISPSSTGNIVMSAFNLTTKQYALFYFDAGRNVVFGNLSFISKYTSNLSKGYSDIATFLYSESSDHTSYLFRLETASEAPNLFYTKDFHTYTQISENRPQQQFNWITSELHNYTSSDGISLQGILYKPENFNQSKKYPVVFNYYEQKSNELNQFIYPDIGADINVPLLVSQGYLVFKADIVTKLMRVGEGALKCVNAAADYLSKFSFVDTTKMAISGHSFGGFETNYIVTHSKRYAAAISGAGMSNQILTYHHHGDGLKGSQNKMLYRPYENPEVYIQNSPVFFVNKVVTPLLIMHNPDDASVEFIQGKYFFIELRKLKKKVWMLSYKGEGHGVGGQNKTDYYTKLLQFLDYYLKGSSIPEWMK